MNLNRPTRLTLKEGGSSDLLFGRFFVGIKLTVIFADIWSQLKCAQFFGLSFFTQTWVNRRNCRALGFMNPDFGLLLRLSVSFLFNLFLAGLFAIQIDLVHLGLVK